MQAIVIKRSPYGSPGDVVEVDPEHSVVARYLRDDVLREVPSDAPPETEFVPYDQRTVPELQQELVDRGLDTDGRKADLVERLSADDLAKTTDPTQ